VQNNRGVWCREVLGREDTSLVLLMLLATTRTRLQPVRSTVLLLAANVEWSQRLVREIGRWRHGVLLADVLLISWTVS
jgi:hypothetical protein